jgi:hypothetical protein
MESQLNEVKHQGREDIRAEEAGQAASQRRKWTGESQGRRGQKATEKKYLIIRTKYLIIRTSRAQEIIYVSLVPCPFKGTSPVVNNRNWTKLAACLN